MDELEAVLEEVREHSELKERKRGAFYLKSSGFLHFHEDPAGLFADLKTGESFERFRVSTGRERRRLLSTIRALLNSSTRRPR